MPIWIHTWSWLPRWKIHDQDTSTSNTQPQPSNMGDICIPIQGLRHLQSCTTHPHNRKIWRTPKTLLSNQTLLQQKYSQAHHQQGGDIHGIQSGCQTRRQHVPGTIFVLRYGFGQNTRRWVDSHGTKQSPICTQGQLTRINRKLVSHLPGNLSSQIMFYLFFMLYVDDGAFVFESRTDIEKVITLPSEHFSRIRFEMHISTGKNNQILNAYFPRPQVYLIHGHYRSLLS